MNFSKKGQSFLALVLLIGAVVVSVGATITALASFFIDLGFGYQASTIAQADAISGAEDALLRLNRNIDFSSTGYSLTVSSTKVIVSVTQNVPSTNYVNVSSTAVVSGRTSIIQVILSENTATGQAKVVTWQVQ